MYSSANKENVNLPTVGKIVLSERQTQYNPQDQIIIKIPATLGNMNPLDTALRFRVRITDTAGGTGNSMPFNCGLDSRAGGYAVIQRIDVYSGLNAVHLETLEGVADFMANWSVYSKDKSQEGLRVLSQGYGGSVGGGGKSTTNQELGLAGVTVRSDDVFSNKQNYNNSMANPYNVVGSGTRTEDSLEARGCEFRDIECVLPLYMSGIFNSNKIWSLMASDGLELRITLRSADEAITTFSGYGYDFLSNDAAYPRPYDFNNSFAAGNLGAVNADGGQIAQSINHGYAIANTNAAAVPQGVTAAVLTTLELMRTDNAALPANARGINSIVQCPLLVGQEFWYKVDAPADTVVNCGRISRIDIAAAAPNNVELTFATPPTIVAGDVAAIANLCCGNNGCQPDVNISVTSGTKATASIDPTCSYALNDVALVVGTVIVPDGYSDTLMNKVESEGGLAYEYQSWNLYRLQDNKAPQSSLLVPTLEARAKSIVVNPVKSDWGTGGVQFVNSALQPDQDGLKDYQWLLNNTLVPDLPIECLRSNTIANGGLNGWNDVSVQEAEKAMERADLKVRRLDPFPYHFCAGRRLSTDAHSYNAKTNEMRLNLKYQGTPSQNKQWYAQMSHIRRCVIKPEGIECIY
jgi:hypothetical protein